jgi:hypothetical protein
MSKHRRAAAAVLVGLCGASAACRTPGIDAAKNAQAVSMRVPGARAAAREDAVSQAQAPPAQTRTQTQPGGQQKPPAARGGGPGGRGRR